MHARPMLALLTAAALTATLAGTAAAQDPVERRDPPPPVSFDRFCQNVPSTYEPFDDIDDSPFKDAVECLAYVGIALGGPGGAGERSFGPDLLVRRDSLASLVVRTMDVAKSLETQRNLMGEAAPYDGTPAFEDTAGNVHEASITRLAESVGLDGVRQNRYQPAAPVTRAQLSRFLANATEKSQNLEFDAPYGVDFYDDDQGGTHEYTTNAITNVGYTQGTGPRTYSPSGTVDRDNMAVFLARFLGLFEQRGSITPAPLRPETLVP